MSQAELTIDLGALKDNWRALDRLSGTAVDTAAVVKADAYGLGLEPAAQALFAAGAKLFFVAHAQEGVALRAALGPAPVIFVFSGLMDGAQPLIRENFLIPLLNSAEQIARFARDLPAHPCGIQLDTGMNRLGLEAEDLITCAEQISALSPMLVMSHLACADEADHPMNAAQRDRFIAMTSAPCFDGVAKSLAATGGTLLERGYHFDLVRPGIGLYGGAPFTAANPVVQLDLPVIQTRTVKRGEVVGYGASWCARTDSRIATISAGYADGLIRAMSGAAHVHVDGTPCPVVGRVSMDLITVDVTELGHAPDRVSILGPDQSIDDLATSAGTIGYEILTSLGARYKRRYIGG